MFDQYGDSVNDWLKVILGAVLIVAALVSMGIRYLPVKRSTGSQDELTLEQKIRGVGVGAGLGMAVGSTSVGAASLVIPPLMLWYRMTAASIVGTSIATSVVLTAVGSGAFTSSGLIAPGVVLYMVVGAIPGVIVGSKLTLRVPEKPLEALLSIVVLVAGVALLIASGE
jgi:uncharacterized membrane protein YfcA